MNMMYVFAFFKRLSTEKINFCRNFVHYNGQDLAVEVTATKAISSILGEIKLSFAVMK
jgi:hypothetical protein